MNHFIENLEHVSLKHHQSTPAFGTSNSDPLLDNKMTGKPKDVFKLAEMKDLGLGNSMA